MRSPSSLPLHWLHQIGWCLLAFLASLMIHVWMHPTPSNASLPPTSQLVEQGRDAYQAGQYQDAIAPLQQAIQTYTDRQAPLNRALALSYLALVYQELGDRPQAQVAIETSVSLFPSQPKSDQDYQVHAQVFSTYGELLLAWGQLESAISSWQTASQSYQWLHDQTGLLGTEINQIQALRLLGHYRQAERRTTRLETRLAELPHSNLAITAWRSLGNTQMAMGQYDTAQAALETSLTIAQEHQQVAAMGAAFLSLGNLERIRGDRQLEQYLLFRQQPLARQSFCPTANLQGWVDSLQEQDETNHYQQAISYYQQAMQADASTSQQIRAHLNRFSVKLALDPSSVSEEIPSIVTQLQSLPTSRFSAYALIHFAQNLTCLATSNPLSDAALVPSPETLLNHAVDMAQALGDRRAESYAWGTLGRFYEEQYKEKYGEQYEDQEGELLRVLDQNAETALSQAKQTTDQAIRLAQQIQATDMVYRWQWQMGRSLKAEGKREEAIAHYRLAFENLKTLRFDLTVLDRDIRFSFRDQIEPLYRQFADLLLRSPPQMLSQNSIVNQGKAGAIADGNELEYQPSQTDLKQAREVLEALQLAELDNFFQDACSQVKAESIDTMIDEQSRSSAVLYSIILGDRLDLILKLPSRESSSNDKSVNTKSGDINLEDVNSADINSADINSADPDEDGTNLQYYSIPVDRQEVRDVVLNLRRQLTRPHTSQSVKIPAFQVYQWLIQPIEADLRTYQIDHLVFVLDGILRNIPMAALYDGQDFVGDRYAISLSPGLQLLETDTLNRQAQTLLAAGLSESRAGFPALPGVETELDQITQVIPTTTQLLNEQFTDFQVETTLNRDPISIVHFATHGQFSSQAADTFLLAYDDKIQVNELRELLGAQNRPISDTYIDLLVLSACQTASGDDRAALGLAGVALRAGARATLASLWSVDDQATTLLISEFYRQLYRSDRLVSKVEALRLAQKTIRELEIQGTRPYAHPRYWAAFVLLGNWI
ncbi:MAG: CHAT domain-containing protein [Leptolyngbyaceae cyanobacterium]